MTVTSRADGDSESESLRLRSVRLYAVIDGPMAGLNLKPLMPRDHAAAAPTLALRVAKPAHSASGHKLQNLTC